MTLLDEPSTTLPTDETTDETNDRHDDERDLGRHDAPTIDLRAPASTQDVDEPDRDDPTSHAGAHAAVDHDVVEGPVVVDPSGRVPWRGMRIRRVRLASVAKISMVFSALGFVVVVATAVLLWSVARGLGLVESLEQTMTTSLGLETFQIDGGSLFRLLVTLSLILSVFGWLVTVLLAAVYNASCAVFGGLAVETGPLRRRHRVFSFRHRRFVTVRT